MKKIIVFLLLLLNAEAFSQWAQYRFTSGFKDKNPVFASKYNASNHSFFPWEYLAFERWSGANSQICVLKIGVNGPIDTVKYLTNTSTQKRNPSISYVYSYGQVMGVPYALAIWEEYKNSRWDLYASSFDTVSGWSSPYAFDTTNYNKSAVKIYGNESSSFLILYEKNNDIICKQFDSRTKQVTYDTNITSTDTAICSNPYASVGMYTYVAYEKMKSDNKKAIYFRYKTGASTWTSPDTAAYLGNNIICEFGAGSFLYPEVVFQSDRTGKYKLYSTQIFPTSQISQNLLSLNQNAVYNYSAIRTFMFPMITDNITWQIFSYIRKSDITKLICGVTNGIVYDSTILGDSSLTVKPSINRGIISVHMAIVWIAFTKDSLSFSNIYAKKTYVLIGEINKISSNIPERFELYQNYPNPFNPATNIRFTIPENGKSKIKNSVTTLKIYNILGKEIATLVNEKLNAGTYEIPFSINHYTDNQLPSGVYFYKLVSGSNIDVKRMVLMK